MSKEWLPERNQGQQGKKNKKIILKNLKIRSGASKCSFRSLNMAKTYEHPGAPPQDPIHTGLRSKLLKRWFCLAVSIDVYLWLMITFQNVRCFVLFCFCFVLFCFVFSDGHNSNNHLFSFNQQIER